MGRLEDDEKGNSGSNDHLLKPRTAENHLWTYNNPSNLEEDGVQQQKSAYEQDSRATIGAFELGQWKKNDVVWRITIVPLVASTVTRSRWSTFGTRWNRRVTSQTASRQICSSRVMPSCQHGKKSWHEELRQSSRQKWVQPFRSEACLLKWPVSARAMSGPGSIWRVLNNSLH